jgi:hypothetical protein
MCEMIGRQVLGQREWAKKALKFPKRILQQQLMQCHSILLDVSA